MELLSILLFLSIAFQYNEDTKHKMFLKAILHDSTAPYYVLIKVTDLNTNQTKEICTSALSLIDALQAELKLEYSFISPLRAKTNSKFIKTLKRNKDLHFYFRKAEALRDISFPSYDTTQLNIVKKKFKVQNIIDAVIKHKNFEYIFEGTMIEQPYLAHLLLQEGIMVESGCLAGYVLNLELFEK